MRSVVREEKNRLMVKYSTGAETKKSKERKCVGEGVRRERAEIWQRSEGENGGKDKILMRE